MRGQDLTRRGILRGTAGAVLAGSGPVRAQVSGVARRSIPSSGEALPVIGLGTWIGFDVGEEEAGRARLGAVLRTLLDGGGRVIDSSPMYGRAEAVVGDLLAEAGTRPRAFLATKVWTRGREAGLAQMRQSLARLRTDRVDLMQVHNLLDWRVHLPVLRAWKEEGRIRHLGLSHYTESAFDEVEAALRAEPVDVLQINYALDDRAAEARLLPLAAERGVAVLVNRPFGGGGLLARLKDRPLPGYAAELGCASWAEILLKFVIGHPAVTCAIPGTGSPAHMAANLRAGTGPLPDAALRRRMAEL